MHSTGIDSSPFFCLLCMCLHASVRPNLSGTQPLYLCIDVKIVSRPPRQWLERQLREQEVVGSIPGHERQKSLKLVVLAFPLGAQDCGNSTTTGPPVSG